MVVIPETHRDLLTGEVVLATNGVDGQPQLTAIVVRLADDGTIDTSLGAGRQKYKNIERDPHVTVFRADPEVPMRTIEVRATAEIIPDPDKSWSRAYAAQLGFDIDAIDGPGDVRSRVRLHPVKVNVLAPGRGPGEL